MSLTKPQLYTGAATALIAAAALGFGLSRMTPAAPAPPPAPAEAKTAAPSEPETVAISPEAIRAAEITVAPASEGAFETEIIAPGTVVATSTGQAILTARSAGAVTRIYKRLGDAVRAGEPVALIESRDAAQAVADRSVAGSKVSLAQLTLAREKRLFEERVSPRQDYEQAQAALAQAVAEARRSQAAVSAGRVAGDGRSVVVSSPIAGRITSVGVGAGLGAYVQAETELFRVADPRQVQVEAAVSAVAASNIAVGDHAVVSIDGRDARMLVRAVTPSVDPQTRAATVVLIPEAGLELRPGQLVQVSLHSTARAGPEGVIVPEDAVQTLGDRSVVFVRTPEGFAARAVRAGRRNNGRVQVLSGLETGTSIATKGSFLLKAELGKASTAED